MDNERVDNSDRRHRRVMGIVSATLGVAILAVVLLLIIGGVLIYFYIDYRDNLAVVVDTIGRNETEIESIIDTIGDEKDALNKLIKAIGDNEEDIEEALNKIVAFAKNLP